MVRYIPEKAGNAMKRIESYAVSPEEALALSKMACYALSVCRFKEPWSYDVSFALKNDLVTVDVGMKGVARSCSFSWDSSNATEDVSKFLGFLHELRGNVRDCGETELGCVSLTADLSLIGVQGSTARFSVKSHSVVLYEIG